VGSQTTLLFQRDSASELVQVTLAEMREALALRFGGEGIVRVRGVVPAQVS